MIDVRDDDEDCVQVCLNAKKSASQPMSNPFEGVNFTLMLGPGQARGEFWSARNPTGSKLILKKREKYAGVLW